MNNNYNNSKNVSFIQLYDNSSKKLNIEEILEKEYKYILEELNNENFSLDMMTCNIFKEISYNEHVIGFVAYDVDRSSILLKFVYILPQYRGNGLFLEEIKDTYNNGHVLKIINPNRTVIEKLISFGFAEKINDSLVLTSIELLIKASKSSSSTENENNDEYVSTNIYDINVNTPFSFKIITYGMYDLSYLETSSFKTYFKNEVEQEKYFEDIVNMILRKDLEIERRLLLLKNNLPSKDINIKSIFSTDKIDPLYEQYLNNGTVTSKTLKEIKQQLFIDFTRSNIRKDSIQQRLDYLVKNFIKKQEIDQNIVNPCPYCGNELDYSERYCVSCGYDIFNDLNIKNRSKFLFEEVLKEQQSYKYSLTGKREKINTLSKHYRTTLAMQKIIELLNIRNYKTIFDEIANVYSINGTNLKQAMLDRKLITYDVDEENWFVEAHEYTLSELKDILREHNLKQSGKKNELINRISSSISLSDVQSKIPKITQYALDFKESSKLIEIHNKLLKNYIYSEYEDFYLENKTESIDEITINFLEKHVKRALETRNHNQLIDSLRKQFIIYSKNKDIEELIRIELKIFIININMLFIDEVYYSYYEPITEETFKFLHQLIYEYDYQEMVFLLNMIYNTFDKNDLNLSLDETTDILNRLIKENTLRNLNNRIKYNHYSFDYKQIYNNQKKAKTKITTLDGFF